MAQLGFTLLRQIWNRRTNYFSGSLINSFPDSLPLFLSSECIHSLACNLPLDLCHCIPWSWITRWQSSGDLLHINHWPNPFSSSAERPYNKRNNTKLVSPHPRKAMKVSSECMGSAWHWSKADGLGNWQISSSRRFMILPWIKETNWLALVWTFFFPDALSNECIRNQNSSLHRNESPLQSASRLE